MQLCDLRIFNGKRDWPLIAEANQPGTADGDMYV